MQKEEQVLTIEESSFMIWIRRILFTGCILFSVYMFRENPIFFSLTTLVSVVAISGDERLIFNIHRNKIEVRSVFLIPLLNKTRTIRFTEISGVKFRESQFDWIGLGLNAIGIRGSKSKEAMFEFQFPDGKANRYRAVGSSKTNRDVVRFIEQRIKDE